MSAYQDYLDRVAEYRTQYPSRRTGQAHVVVWLADHSARDIPTGDAADAYFVDAFLPTFLAYVQGCLGEPNAGPEVPVSVAPLPVPHPDPLRPPAAISAPVAGHPVPVEAGQ